MCYLNLCSDKYWLKREGNIYAEAETLVYSQPTSKLWRVIGCLQPMQFHYTGDSCTSKVFFHTQGYAFHRRILTADLELKWCRPYSEVYHNHLFYSKLRKGINFVSVVVSPLRRGSGNILV